MQSNRVSSSFLIVLQPLESCEKGERGAALSLRPGIIEARARARAKASRRPVSKDLRQYLLCQALLPTKEVSSHVTVRITRGYKGVPATFPGFPPPTMSLPSTNMSFGRFSSYSDDPSSQTVCSTPWIIWDEGVKGYPRLHSIMGVPIGIVGCKMKKRASSRSRLRTSLSTSFSNTHLALH